MGNVIATFTFTEKYFREDLQQWVWHRSKWRKYEPLLCIIFIAIGIISFLGSIKLRILAFYCLGVGGFESIRHVVWRRKWLQGRIASQLYNTSVKLVFSEHGIKQIIPDECEATLQELSLVT